MLFKDSLAEDILAIFKDIPYPLTIGDICFQLEERGMKIPYSYLYWIVDHLIGSKLIKIQPKNAMAPRYIPVDMAGRFGESRFGTTSPVSRPGWQGHIAYHGALWRVNTHRQRSRPSVHII